MTHLTKIVWRERFNAPAIAKMAEMGTLPREEIELDTRGMDGEEVAVAIAKADADNGGEMFRTENEIVILEPAEFAGTYKIYVDYEPTFTAWKEDLD